MKKTQTETNQQAISRRSFLRKGAVVSGGVAGAVAMPGEVLAESEPALHVKVEDRGYHVTDHIVEYYKSAKV